MKLFLKCTKNLKEKIVKGDELMQALMQDVNTLLKFYH